MTTETTTTNKHWWVNTLKGILFIIIGCIALYHPGEALYTIGLYIGYFMLVSGIFYLFALFSKKNNDRSKSWYLIEGLLDVILGILIVTSPVLTVTVLPYFIGFWIVFLGISQLSFSFGLDKGFSGIKTWFIVLGIISLFFGFMIINSPLISGIQLTVLLGIFFLAYGIVQTFASFKLKNTSL
ncbi:HdeD family acid-resistance protein [Tenacibaculum sp. TC6]|uniref:HdeD family acid-resistance protein n=1 Tax=Tenacibaculum sp. TC6 TaxID=3423223 RepID=UPI003D35B648